MKNIYDIVLEVLSKREKYLSEDKQILKAKVYTDVMLMDKNLLSLLLSDDRIKEEFFTEVKDTLVFDKQKFSWLIESKEFLPDSYTRYSNKIGLTSNGDFISQKNDVVLDFPYKDCYLQGGQDKEDQKRNEIFYHETIASDQITRMLEPKVFTNAKRYTKEGIEENIEITDGDNLIIKGNNLIALSSLLKRYEGKIKLIYIDPPYNTGNDSFGYNDSFNQSTWLTFMKNRLELAHKLLAPNGSIFVNLDDREAHYCKVLMDDIFGRENYLNDIIWNSTKSVTNTAIISVSHTHTLVYFKDKEYYVKNRTEFRLSEHGEGFSNPDKDPRGPWKADPFQVGGWRPNQQYEIINPNTGAVYKPNEGNSWKNDFNKYKELVKDNRIVFGVAGEAGPQRKRFLFEAKERGRVAKTIWDDVGTTTNGTQHLKKMFGKSVFNNPKPEQLVKRIIELATFEDDIVLDFFLGSGTTAAVAHKMGRRYIGVEQMDYINEVTIERLKKVIEGEQGGISKDEKWQGGGSFVYCELLEDVLYEAKQILGATEKDLEQIKEKIYNDNRILPYITKNELYSLDEEFSALSLEEKRKALLSLLDKNKIYVNYSNIDDESLSIKSEDVLFTKSFYNSRI